MLPRVLLVIKNDLLRQKLASHLNGRSIVDQTTSKSSELLQSLQNEPTDLVIAEQSIMPKPINENISMIKKLPESPHIVVISEGDDPVERADKLAAGCDAVLSSDLPFVSITRVVDKVLGGLIKIEKQNIDLDSVFAEPHLSDFISRSPAMKTFMDVVNSVVTSNASILLLGETGVGKERLARAIHNESLRVKGPFVPVNCGALPESLLESELFGHEKGSFTGATRQRRGCFELAHNGTVFLDEIGDLPYHLQVKLLRVLQDREVQRVGSESSFKVDVRVIAATNQDLNDSVKEGRFRRDLFYRLNVIALTIPPLRERKEDIPELLNSYIGYFRPRIKKKIEGIKRSAMEVLIDYDWPGNVREMINVIERAILLCSSSQITLKDLPDDILSKSNLSLPHENSLEGKFPLTLPENWEELPFQKLKNSVISGLEIMYFSKLLKNSKGKIGQAAEMAGMNPRALFGKMKRHKLRKEPFRSKN